MEQALSIDSQEMKIVPPYFSLILPIYNVAPYLERCIHSILEQNFKDYEIILVDDGSSDESSQISDEYANRYPNIRVIHKENGGLSSARNAGLEIAEGKYIWWIDSDDWIEKGALEELYVESCKNDPDIVKFNYYRIEKDKKEIRADLQAGMYEGAKKVGELLSMAFRCGGKYLLSACFHVYKRDFLRNANIRFVSEKSVGSEDYLFNLCVLPMARSVAVLSKPLYVYSMREGSLTQTYKKDLPDRYENLYGILVEEYAHRGLLALYQEGIAFFYVWHLVRGTCMTQEYQAIQGHSLRDGRRNVKRMLSLNKFRMALSRCNIRRLSLKQKIMMMAMKLRMESVFYYLYVIKPGVSR